MKKQLILILAAASLYSCSVLSKLPFEMSSRKPVINSEVWNWYRNGGIAGDTVTVVYEGKPFLGVSYDINGDGVFEMAAYYKPGNYEKGLNPNMIVFDENGDGTPDWLYKDNDLDGIVDKAYRVQRKGGES